MNKGGIYPAPTGEAPVFSLYAMRHEPLADNQECRLRRQNRVQKLPDAARATIQQLSL